MLSMLVAMVFTITKTSNKSKTQTEMGKQLGASLCLAFFLRWLSLK